MAGGPKQALLTYLEFLKQSGFLYAEGGVSAEALRVAPAAQPAAPQPAAVPAPRRTTTTAKTVAAAGPAVQAAPKRMPVAAPPAGPNVQGAPIPAGVCLAPEERRARVADAMVRVQACQRCPLGGTRHNIVYSDGDVMATIMFVGEAPGEEEDRQGLPFVGRSGQLLTKMIEAIGFQRAEVYICNTVKCRPPGNRDPLPEEKDACEHFLREQLEIIRPKLIVALGAHAAQYLCKSEESIGRLRGVWHSYHGVPLRATYHPAFLLRSPGMKGKAWEDFQAIHQKYGELNPADVRKIWQKE
jgi:DNA polymerase